MPVFHSLRCPVCQNLLSQQEKVWRCANEHSFDVAKEGYLNVLLAHKKKTSTPGDNKEMLQSRRRFLTGGYYDFLPDYLLQLAQKHLEFVEGMPKIQALDVGCGEGFYTAYLQAGSADWLDWAGLDISRDGVRLAAKAYPNIPFVVGNSYELPYETGSQSLVMQIFAPSSPDEVKRVLKPGGLYMLINPAENHLMGLKEKIYDTPKEHTTSVLEQAGLELVELQVLSQEVTINSPAALQDLFKMTPFYWTVGEVRRKELSGLDSLITPLAFHIGVYRRHRGFDAEKLWG